MSVRARGIDYFTTERGLGRREQQKETSHPQVTAVLDCSWTLNYGTPYVSVPAGIAKAASDGKVTALRLAWVFQPPFRSGVHQQCTSHTPELGICRD